MSKTYVDKMGCVMHQNGKIVVLAADMAKLAAAGQDLEIEVLTTVPDYHVSNVYITGKEHVGLVGTGIAFKSEDEEPAE